VKQKVFAYITHQERLLVFKQPDFPEAGIQVPAGTVEVGEQLENAVLREAFEETGLANLMLDCFLGQQTRDMSDFGLNEVHHRSFYHLGCSEDPPTRWQHEESHPSTGAVQEAIVFELFWIPLSDSNSPLIADYGIMLPRLLDRLSLLKGR
jgi:ADP-ribose pyrophosphatase YjhB (NUDIX family)